MDRAVWLQKTELTISHVQGFLNFGLLFTVESDVFSINLGTIFPSKKRLMEKFIRFSSPAEPRPVPNKSTLHAKKNLWLWDLLLRSFECICHLLFILSVSPIIRLLVTLFKRRMFIDGWLDGRAFWPNLILIFNYDLGKLSPKRITCLNWIREDLSSQNTMEAPYPAKQPARNSFQTESLI